MNCATQFVLTLPSGAMSQRAMEMTKTARRWQDKKSPQKITSLPAQGH